MDGPQTISRATLRKVSDNDTDTVRFAERIWPLESRHFAAPDQHVVQHRAELSAWLDRKSSVSRHIAGNNTRKHWRKWSEHFRWLGNFHYGLQPHDQYVAGDAIGQRCRPSNMPWYAACAARYTLLWRWHSKFGEDYRANCAAVRLVAAAKVGAIWAVAILSLFDREMLDGCDAVDVCENEIFMNAHFFFQRRRFLRPLTVTRLRRQKTDDIEQNLIGFFFFNSQLFFR